MVEMRIVLSGKPSDVASGLVWFGGGEPKYKATLQYRVKDNHAGHNEDPDWGQWQDVPVEKSP